MSRGGEAVAGIPRNSTQDMMVNTASRGTLLPLKYFLNDGPIEEEKRLLKIVNISNTEVYTFLNFLNKKDQIFL